MNKLTRVLVLLSIIGTVTCDMIHDEWMRKNKLPIEHMHDNSIKHMLKGERIRLRV